MVCWKQICFSAVICIWLDFSTVVENLEPTNCPKGTTLQRLMYGNTGDMDLIIWQNSLSSDANSAALGSLTFTEMLAGESFYIRPKRYKKFYVVQLGFEFINATKSMVDIFDKSGRRVYATMKSRPKNPAVWNAINWNPRVKPRTRMIKLRFEPVDVDGKVPVVMKMLFLCSCVDNV